MITASSAISQFKTTHKAPEDLGWVRRRDCENEASGPIYEKDGKFREFPRGRVPEMVVYEPAPINGKCLLKRYLWNAV
jgi:hypothetical protein